MLKSDNNGKIVGALLLGAVTGIAIGAALGILFSPEKGVVMRKKLVNGSEDLSGAVKGKFRNFVQEVKKEVGALTGSVSQKIDEGVEEINRV